MKQPKVSVPSFFLAFTVGLILTWPATFLPVFLVSPIDGGPLDFTPRLEASALSPDGTWSVQVLRQRNPSYSRYVGAEIYAKVYDHEGRVLYEREIGSDGAWDELNGAFKSIDFDGDFIRIKELWGRSHVISISELKR